MIVDHLAVLTASLQKVSDSLPDSCQKHEIETFPGEGTQEQYVDLGEHSPRLLLLQPIAAGPYQRALSKRGPGLHHLGAKTASLSAMVPTLTKQGLLLHPISIQTLAQGVVWLCRPGLPFLIELAEGSADEPFEVIELGLPRTLEIPGMVSELFENLRIRQAEGDGLELKAGKRLINIALE